MQAGKLLRILSQRAFDPGSRFGVMLEAALPEFLGRCIQKDRWPGAQQVAVRWLDESPAAKRNHTVAVKGARQQIAQRIGFGYAEGGFSLEAKNLGNGTCLAGLDPSVEIHKVPGKPPGKLLSDSVLA